MTEDEKLVLEKEQEKLEGKMKLLIAPVEAKMEAYDGKSKEQFEAIQNDLKSINDTYKALQKAYDELDIKLQKANNPMKDADVRTQIKNVLDQTDFLKSRESAKKGGIIDLKGIDIMNYKVGSDVSRTTDAIPYQWTPFQYGPQRRHIREYLPVGTTTAPQIWMPYESAVTDSTARVAEAGAKLQSDWTTTVAKYPVEKIATFLVFSEELYDDMAGLVSYITTQWIEKLKRVEDTQLLYGTGTNQLYGLTVKAAAYSDSIATAAVDRLMVADFASVQVQTADFTPNLGLVHPTTLAKMRQTRSTTYEWIKDPNTPMIINGVQWMPHAAMTQEDFLVGDFTMGAQVFDRMSANIRFYDQDSTNARYNKITAVIEERLALVTYQANAFCYGNFTIALAKGSA